MISKGQLPYFDEFITTSINTSLHIISDFAYLFVLSFSKKETGLHYYLIVFIYLLKGQF